MALDPMLNPYVIAVTTASGLVAAGMHATSLAGSGQPWPSRRTLTANLISTAFVGVCVAYIISKLPYRVDIVGVLIASGLTGHVLGPRAVVWLFGGLVKAAQQTPVVGKLIPDPPPESPEIPPATIKEESDDPQAP